MTASSLAAGLPNSLLSFCDLQRISGYNRRADVERWAKDNGIAVKPCRGGVWTTLEAVNVALGVSAANDETAAYDPNII